MIKKISTICPILLAVGFIVTPAISAASSTEIMQYAVNTAPPSNQLTTPNLGTDNASSNAQDNQNTSSSNDGDSLASNDTAGDDADNSTE